MNHHEIENRAFRTLTLEVVEAVEAQDAMTACVALGELEGLWMHSAYPTLRERTAAFMRQHAAHGDFVKFTANA